MSPHHVFVALLHHPAYDKNRQIVTTSITNFDIHDISRTCRTYGVEKFFIVHPMESQRFFAQRIIKHWQEGFGSTYNTTRREALSIIEVTPDLKEMLDRIKYRYGTNPLTVATSARKTSKDISFTSLKNDIHSEKASYLLLLGTGWGLPDELIAGCDYLLEPVQANSDFNHLSVRAAAAIMLDRLLGSR